MSGGPVEKKAPCGKIYFLQVLILRTFAGSKKVNFMSCKDYLMCVACLSRALAAAGQDSARWSLQECIDYAIAHNIQLRQDKITEEQGAANLLQKRAELFPSLSFSVTQAMDYRPLQKSEASFVANGIANSSSSKVTENGSYGLNASWTVWDGGANRKNVKAQKIQNRISALATQAAANDIQEQIAQLYVQILYSKDALDVNNAMRETAQSQFERGKEMFGQGQISKADLAQLESQAASAQYDCVSTRTQIDNYKRQLKGLLEITDDRDFDVAGIGTNDEAAMQLIPGVDEVYRKALDLRPEIQSSRLGIDAADLDIGIAKAGYYPSVSLTAGIGDSHYSGSRERAGEQMRQNLNASAGVTLSIPIFDNRRNKTNVQKAKLDKMDSELQLQDRQNELYSTVEEYWLNACSSQQKYVAANARLKSAQASYELLDEQFKNGLKNIVELMNGRDELMSAQQDRLQSKYNTLLNIQLLKFYQGESINL